MKEKTTNYNLTYQIALASLVLSLSILILSLSYILPGLDILFFIFVPFISAGFALRSNYKGQILYILGIVAISFIDMQIGFFNLLPKCIIGIIFGDIIKKIKLNFFSYLGLSIINFIVEWLLIYPIKWIYQIDLIQTYSTFFKINVDTFNLIFPVFYLGISFITCLITYMFCKDRINSISYINSTIDIDKPISYILLGSICYLGLIICHFVFLKLSYVFLLILFIMSCYLYIKKFNYTNTIIFSVNLGLLIVSLIISIILGFAFIKECKYLCILNTIIYINIYYLFMIKYEYRLSSNFKEQKDLLNN